ncbi:MAG: type II secretion system protein [Candidatus Omnitrophica bacterium]|nr:type II secretion system protein [Candidatus Omnitrophota bacterium]MDD5592872.1 type II secretion system protein [Candidatus Omnitrophota bacterium]
MKKGFTLLELIVVMIIIGILATLGIQQYARATERARGAEARQVLGQIRTTAAGFRLQNGNSCAGFGNDQAGIGTETDRIPIDCTRATHYFRYGVTAATADAIILTATRCTGTNGKQPGASTAFQLTLNTDFVLGTDTWAGNGGY